MAKANSPGRLTLVVDGPKITLDRLSRVTHLWAHLLQSVSTEATGRKHAVRWVLETVDGGGHVAVAARPEAVSRRIDAGILEQIVDAVVQGIAHLETRPATPAFFSSRTLGIVKELALLTDSENKTRLIVSTANAQPTAITSATARAVDNISGPVIATYGSIEGRLEELASRSKNRFYVKETLSGRQIPCSFDDGTIPLEIVLGGFKRRVSVSGVIRSKAFTGERLSVRASQFTIFNDDASLRSTDNILDMWKPE